MKEFPEFEKLKYTEYLPPICKPCFEFQKSKMITTITETQLESSINENITNNINVNNVNKGFINNKIEKVHPKKEKPIPSYDKYKFLKWEFETPVIWTSVFFIVLWHVIAVYSFITYPIFSKIPLVIYGFIIGGISGFGITAGAHRYFTHRSFKAKTPLKLILLFCYSVAGQNKLIDWVRDHRVHHKFSETDADPHNAARGFFFSHVGWLMMRKHPEVIRKGRTLDLTDLTNDPYIRFHHNNWLWIKILCCFLIPSAIPVYLWGEEWYYSIVTICFIRYMISLNSTWAVNSFAHIWGNRPYDKKIFPAENLAVSFFAMGEGYHNYHHTFPWDYRAAEMGNMLNLTTFYLNLFEKIGWAYDMKTPTSELIKKMAENHGDGTHYKWGHEVPLEANLQNDEEEKNKDT